MKKRYSIFLYVFYGMYFLAMGMTSFIPKYFGEIGMSDSQIGILMSVPGICGIFFQSFWGILSDRVTYKRNILLFAALAGGFVYFITGFSTNFWLILMGMIVITLLFLPVTPVSSSIALEYTEKVGLSFGPIRMSGTIGYQIGALVIGFILVASLKGIFQIIGVLYMLAALTAIFLPPVQGHQHGKEKISPLFLLKDKRLLLLLLICFVACTTSAFYMTFFTKHLGDLGIGNDVTGIITVVSVLLEIPFLLFSQKLYPKMSIWHWLILGLILNGVRWIGLGFAKDIGGVLICNIPAVSIMACFEFFPALYINEISPKELKGT
ncbi:MAG: MFS transporter, partial [Oscillospiraceae bacterium]